LDQDVPARKLRAFLGHIHIGDAAVGRFQVGFGHREQLGVEAPGALIRTVGGAQRRGVGDGGLDFGPIGDIPGNNAPEGCRGVRRAETSAVEEGEAV